MRQAIVTVTGVSKREFSRGFRGTVYYRGGKKACVAARLPLER